MTLLNALDIVETSTVVDLARGRLDYGIFGPFSGRRLCREREKAGSRSQEKVWSVRGIWRRSSLEGERAAVEATAAATAAATIINLVVLLLTAPVDREPEIFDI